MRGLRKLLLASALAMVAASSFAADVAVKATPNPLFTGYPYASNGWYYGLNTFGATGSVNASGVGVNTNSIVTNQGSIGGTVGYVWATPNVFYAVEAMFDWTNINGTSQGFSFTGPAAFEQRFKIGTPLVNVLNFFPNNPFGNITTPPFPALPNGQVATNIHPYLMGSLHEDDVSLNFGLMKNTAWQVSPGVGIGAMGQLTNGLAADVWTEMQFPQNGVCVGGNVVCANQSTKFIAGLAFYY